MTAKAILPFMHLGAIVPECVRILEEHVGMVSLGSISNNLQHYRLTECYQLLTSYHEIVGGDSKLEAELRNRLYGLLVRNSSLLEWDVKSKVSPTVQEIFIRICY